MNDEELLLRLYWIIDYLLIAKRGRYVHHDSYIKDTLKELHLRVFKTKNCVLVSDKDGSPRVYIISAIPQSRRQLRS